MRLFNFWRSSASYRVRLALEFKGLLYEYVAVNLTKGEQHDGPHRARNPWGGVPVLEVNTDELNDPRYAANPADRCYFCKSELWSRLAPLAAERGLAVVVDGTNADDLSDHRPGGRAARERGVSSPLADLGLTKGEIRALSAVRGIPTWDQPSSPCLSLRSRPSLVQCRCDTITYPYCFLIPF